MQADHQRLSHAADPKLGAQLRIQAAEQHMNTELRTSPAIHRLRARVLQAEG